jgi:hypothetical protein
VDASAVSAVAACPGALDAVRDAGFDGVDIDVRPFRSGSMNDLLDPAGAPR